jgi:hypothetical protein
MLWDAQTLVARTGIAHSTAQVSARQSNILASDERKIREEGVPISFV